MRRLDDLEQQYMKDDLPIFRIGDTVDVHVSIVETVEVGRGKTEEKERIQIFEGDVIARHGGEGLRATFTVRKTSGGIGVERIFPLHSPNVDTIDVVRLGRVRRGKLYYLRDLRGKKAKIRERRIR